MMGSEYRQRHQQKHQQKIFCGAVVGVIAINFLGIHQPVAAFVTHQGWTYTVDTHNDSTPFNGNGHGPYEIFNLAYQVVDETVTIAINSNVNLSTGNPSLVAQDGAVHFSDLLLNFTGQTLDEANGDLFGIRFAANNDSGAGSVGIYSDVTAMSVAHINDGWTSLGAYNDSVIASGVTPSIGDLLHDDAYFDLEQATPTAIATGTKIGDIEFIANVNNLGLNLDLFEHTGTELIAFTFDAGLLPTGKALYHLAMECNNDMIAGTFDFNANSDKPDDVPSPAVILPTIFGLFSAATHRKQNFDHC